MGQIGDVKLIDDQSGPPAGTLQDFVNEKCLIFTEVADVDLSQEIVKMQKKLTNAEKMAASYEAKMSDPNYEQKVPQQVRETNTEKLEASRKEAAELRRALAMVEQAIGAK